MRLAVALTAARDEHGSKTGKKQQERWPTSIHGNLGCEGMSKNDAMAFFKSWTQEKEAKRKNFRSGTSANKTTVGK